MNLDHYTIQFYTNFSYMNVITHTPQHQFLQDNILPLECGTKVCHYGNFPYNSALYPAVLLRKRITNNPAQNERISIYFANEIAILKFLNTQFPQCNHFCIMMASDEESMVLERCSSDVVDTIYKGINPLTNRQLTHLDRLQFALDTVKAVQFLHSIGIVHKDLKPDNLLINQRLRKVLLSDFGYSARRTDDFALLLVGTFDYMAPEMIYAMARKKGKLPRGTLVEALDLWSLGMTLKVLFDSRLAPAFIAEEGVLPDFNWYARVTKFCQQNPSQNLYGLLTLNPRKRTPLNQVVDKISSAIRIEHQNLLVHFSQK